ncbi:MAG: hypothetical protein ACE5F1_13375 [Planctomycetota bacterium]
MIQKTRPTSALGVFLAPWPLGVFFGFEGKSRSGREENAKEPRKRQEGGEKEGRRRKKKRWWWWR